MCLEHEGEDGAIPEIFCNDERCGQVFHKACIVEVCVCVCVCVCMCSCVHVCACLCLNVHMHGVCTYALCLRSIPANTPILSIMYPVLTTQWIRTRPESRMTFNTILGLCPYCKQVHCACWPYVRMSVSSTPSG